MNVGPRSWQRWLLTLGLCSVALLLSGCVYLRLLALKRQLGDFDKHFALQTANGVRLRCLDPVLLAGDMRWLGIVPEKIAKQGRAEQWRVHWVKEAVTGRGEPEPAAQDIELEINFSDNKLTGFFVAERYFAFIPKSFFVGLLRGLGDANIDKGKRRVSAEIALPTAGVDDGRPTIASLAALLGSPTERQTKGETTLLRYRYLPPTPGSNNGDFDLFFTFDTASGELLQLEGRSPVGQMLLNFERSRSANPTPPSTPAATR